MEDRIFDVESMCYDDCEAILQNPDRGLRMEIPITLGKNLTTYPTKTENPYEIIESMLDKYKEDSPRLCQFYVYLSNYSDCDIDEIAFSQLDKALSLFRENNIRVLLRFAYSTESIPDVPYNRVKNHLSQIKKWFDDNEKLINDTLYCLQTGLIGFWGEGHSYRKFCYFDIPKVINDVCTLAPKGIYTQVRYYKMLKKVKPCNIQKVGFHDDYIVGDLNHKWAIVPQKKTKAFNRVMENGKYTINDAEMPWGYAHYNDDKNRELCDNLDGKKILKQLSLYHITSFSLEHSYKENGGSYSMDKWKSQYLRYEDVNNLGVYVNPNLFTNSNGLSVKMSIYDIIRLHLGYQLLLYDCFIKNNVFNFSIINYGFAAPLNFNYLAVVTESNGDINEIEVEEYDKNAIQSNTKISYKIHINDNEKVLGIKMDTFKGRGVNIRFANKNTYKNGINLL